MQPRIGLKIFYSLSYIQNILAFIGLLILSTVSCNASLSVAVNKDHRAGIHNKASSAEHA